MSPAHLLLVVVGVIALFAWLGHQLGKWLVPIDANVTPSTPDADPTDPAPPPSDPYSPLGQWVVHTWPDGRMQSLRWSVPDAAGRYFCTAHYPTTKVGRMCIESTAKNWNAKGKKPWEFREYRPVTADTLAAHRATEGWP